MNLLNLTNKDTLENNYRITISRFISQIPLKTLPSYHRVSLKRFIKPFKKATIDNNNNS